jgi:flagellar motor switch protein FliG
MTHFTPLGDMSVQPSLRQAAVLLSCLPPRYVSRVLSRLSPADARALRNQLAKLTESSSEERTGVLRQFLQDTRESARSTPIRRWDAAESMPPTFHFLQPLAPAEIARLIGDELPRTQAVILAQLSPPIATQILAQWPAARRREIVQQLASLDNPSIVVLPDLAQALRQIVARNRARSPIPSAGRHLLARMLDTAEGASRQALLEALHESGLEAADAKPTADSH